MRESKVEAYFNEHVVAAGGARRKMQWIGRPSAPDQFAALPTVGVVLVELKRPGKAAEAAQAREHQRLRAAGARVAVVASMAEVDEFIRGYQGMSDNDLIDRLQTGESMFEKALLAYIMRLLAEKRALALIIAKNGEKK